MEPKYYFVYYECEIFSTNSSGRSTNKCQTVIDKHPIQFQLDCNEKYGVWREDGGSMRKENYMVISWQPLTLEEYKEFKDKVG